MHLGFSSDDVFIRGIFAPQLLFQKSINVEKLMHLCEFLLCVGHLTLLQYSVLASASFPCDLFISLPKSSYAIKNGNQPSKFHPSAIAARHNF